MRNDCKGSDIIMTDRELPTGIAYFITHLTAAFQDVGMYPEDHPKITATTQEAFDRLAGLLQSRDDITIVLIGNNILADGTPLSIPSTYKTAFLRVIGKLGIERITFRRGLPFAEFDGFVRDIGLAGLSHLRSTPYIILGRLELKNRADEKSVDNDAMDEAFNPDAEAVHDLWSQEPEHTIEGIYQNIVGRKRIDMESVDGIVLQFIRSIPRETNPLRLLSQIKKTDEYTFVHTVNVGILTMSLAQYLGFKGSDFYKIGTAAVLHDVGKISIPHDIITKHGALTPEERHVIENHTINGAMHLLALGNISHLAVLAAMEHHIRYDGTGYPRIKRPWETNIVSQMITIADVFDALRTRRPYRDPMTQTEVANVMKSGSGTEFNPYLIERFLSLIEQT